MTPTVESPLPLSAALESIEVEGNAINEKGRVRSQYFVHLCVDEREVVKSTKLKSRSSLLKWEWTETRIWFRPSSKITIMLYRGLGGTKLLKDIVGLYEGNIVDLLENDAMLDLKDKKGNHVAAKMNAWISRIHGSVDNITEFMQKVDADIRRLPSNIPVDSTAAILGEILKSTKTIIDKLTQAHPVLNASWAIVSVLYQVVQETNLQDEAIRDLASTLRELLGTANAIPDLPVLPNTIDVIEELSRQSLRVSSLIDEYTKLSWTRRTVKLQTGLKSRIVECQKICTNLDANLFKRIHIDTNVRVYRNEETLETIKDRNLENEILAWLRPPDSSKNFNEANKKRQIDTCGWFIDGERFRKWYRKPGFLWIKGKAGSGKSILCSSIINDLLRNNKTLAYFFFDGRDSQTDLQLHDKLIRSLISQFSHQYRHIPAQLIDLYKKYGAYQHPPTSQLQDTLRDILDGLPEAYIVIDALDECTNREEALNWIRQLVVVSTDGIPPNIHIAVTSRPERDIEKVFDTLDPHSIKVGESTDNSDDISKFLDVQMESHFKEYDEEFRMEIESRLRDNADGSFRWVALQVAELSKCLSKHEIKTQLEDLPRDLDEVYGRMLNAIDTKYHADTMTLLQWLAFSFYPMYITEIAETITIDFEAEDGPIFKSEKRYRNPRDVLVRCSSLVTESEGFIKLSHFSVKEYLLSSRVAKHFHISKIASHSKITQISAAYLLQFQSYEPLTGDIIDRSPLVPYAAEYWVHHAKSGALDDPAAQKLVLRLFTSETESLIAWIRMKKAEIWSKFREVLWSYAPLSLPKFEILSPLYYAALSGIPLVVLDLINQGAKVNAQCGEYGDALHAASVSGHAEIVKLLIAHGAEVNSQGGEYANALQAASAKGHGAIVKILIDKGAVVNSQRGFYGNALQAAAYFGHDRIVKLLVEEGAEVNAQGGEFGTALQAASIGGHVNIMKVLLDKGADVNSQGGLYGNVLQAASAAGHVDIVKILLDEGADVNSQGGEYGNALQAASSSGHEELVKLLIETGVEVNSQGGKFGNALQAASARGHVKIVKTLLDKGADVNAQGGSLGNALQAAAYVGHDQIVKLLIEKGACVNMQWGKPGSALQAALARGYKAIVEFLLDKGADVNAQGGFYGNALYAASCCNKEEIVRILLDAGADVNLQGGSFGSALSAVSAYGYEAVVKLLLHNGAEVNAQGEYGSALSLASDHGRDAVVKLLLEYGAEEK